jgi:hypothetical protein
MCNAVDGLILEAIERVGGHRLPYRHLLRITSFCDNAHPNIAPGDHIGETIVVTHWECFAIQISHELQRRRERVVAGHYVYVRRHYVAEFHGSSYLDCPLVEAWRRAHRWALQSVPDVLTAANPPIHESPSARSGVPVWKT